MNNKGSASSGNRSQSLTRPSGNNNKSISQTNKANEPRKDVVPRSMMQPIPMRKENGMLVPEGYTMRPVRQAEKAELISVARAMNDDFAPKVQRLFDSEVQAAQNAIRTGLYVSYRCPEFTWDCIRVFHGHKCFCGHLLNEHQEFDGRRVTLPCQQCKCKSFAFIPSRPEDVGEFWFQRRRNFDVSQYRVKCRCKHAHDSHDPIMRNCKEKACGCRMFQSDFLCAACDKHWEEHDTFFETEQERRSKKLPYGQEYIPFNEMPELKNIVLTGREDNENAIDMVPPQKSIGYNQFDPVIKPRK